MPDVMSFDKGFPEVKVTRQGAFLDRIVWRHIGSAPTDLTDLHITKVEAESKPGELPIVKLYLIARMVETDAVEATDA